MALNILIDKNHIEVDLELRVVTVIAKSLTVQVIDQGPQGKLRIEVINN